MNYISLSLFILLALTPLSAKDIYSIDKKTLQFAQKEYGEEAKSRIVSLVKLLNKIDKDKEQSQLKDINDFFNSIDFSSDLKVWKKKDYWATRQEFLNTAEGDCEDYVIAKYFSLRQLGISEKKIFLTYVKAIKYKQSHMVLTYFKTKASTPLVLDNIVKTIELSTKRKDLRPLFSFNGEKIYMAKQRGLGREVPKGKINLKKWTNLILKIKKESI